MQKRIFFNFVGLILVCVVLLVVSLGMLFFRTTQAREMSSIRDEAYFRASLLNDNILMPYRASSGVSIDAGDTRIMIISSDGWTLFDNDKYAGTSQDVNRSDREEFIEAIEYGVGEAVRTSVTFGAETFYYAIRLQDGNVLRLSRSINSLGGVFISTIPALIAITIAVLLIAYIIAKRLTRLIIKPLADIDLDNENGDSTSAHNVNDTVYEELRPYVEKINLQKHEIASRLQQRREFSANVSHELKTPLTTISALSEMMSNGMAKKEDVAEFSQKITGHSKRLINIIEDIIRLSEFDEKKTEKDFTTFDILELAKTVVASLQDNATIKSVTVNLTGEHLQIEANSRLIDELLFNLIDNGIKYNAEGGSVNIHISEDNGMCKISVADTGIGISKQHQSRIFERFYRVDASRSKKTGGTGLGLSIVKHITDHHNGKIILESSEGKGTTIICYIATKS